MRQTRARARASHLEPEPGQLGLQAIQAHLLGEGLAALKLTQVHNLDLLFAVRGRGCRALAPTRHRARALRHTATRRSSKGITRGLALQTQRRRQKTLRTCEHGGGRRLAHSVSNFERASLTRSSWSTSGCVRPQKLDMYVVSDSR